MRCTHVSLCAVLFVSGALLTAGCASSSSGGSTPTMTPPEAGTGTSPRAYLDDDRPIEGDRVVMTVHGLGCPLCAENINKTLAGLPGFAGSDVDMSTGFVTVRFRGEQRPSRADLARAIIDSGFTLVRIDVPETRG